MEITVSRPVHLAEYCYAYSWLRFLEWVIDIIVLYALSYALSFGMSFIYFSINPDQLDAFDSIPYGIAIIIGLTINMLYYFICEAFCNGKTIGKWITGLQVVDLDGNRPTIRRIALRTLARLIPFDYLSFFGTDKWSGEEDLDGFWHDSLSKTYVIQVNKIALFKAMEAVGENNVKCEVEVSDVKGADGVDGVYKPGDHVIYPPVNRVMYVDELLINGKIRCFEIDSNGKKEPAGDYAPFQIKHYRDGLNLCKTCNNHHFDPNQGIVCSISNSKPKLESNTCPNYIGNSKTIVTEYDIQQESIPREKRVNRLTQISFWASFLVFLYEGKDFLIAALADFSFDTVTMAVLIGSFAFYTIGIRLLFAEKKHSKKVYSLFISAIIVFFVSCLRDLAFSYYDGSFEEGFIDIFTQIIVYILTLAPIFIDGVDKELMPKKTRTWYISEILLVVIYTLCQIIFVVYYAIGSQIPD